MSENMNGEYKRVDAAIERHNATMAALANDFPAVAYSRLMSVQNIMQGLIKYSDNVDAGHAALLTDIINCAQHLLCKAAENEKAKS